MGKSTDGLYTDTFVRKHKLNTGCPCPKLRKIIDYDVKLFNPREYKASMAFHLYAFERLEAEDDVDISVDTLTRCVNLTMSGSAELRASKDSVTVGHLEDTLEKYKSLFNKIDTPSFKSANKPLQAASDMMFTNIVNHVTTNFIGFQKRYFRVQLVEYLTTKSIKLTNDQLGYATYRAQGTVHDFKSLIKNPLKHKSFNNKKYHALRDTLSIELPLFAQKMRDNIPLELRGFVKDLALKKNLSKAVSYMYKMGKYLDNKKVKSFSPFPNLTIARHHVLFDIQYLTSVYNEWQLKLDKDAVLVTFPIFRENYKKYIGEMFCYDKLYPKLKDNYNVKSIMTDGYSISFIFTGKDVPSRFTKGAKRPSAKSKKYKAEEALKASKVLTVKKLEPGLYDATKIHMTESDIARYRILGVDPGNAKMLNIKGIDDEVFTITKGHYNDISHITRNVHKKQKLTQTNKRLAKINDALSDTCIRSASLEQYVAYMRIVVANWDFLWKHNQCEQFAAIKYDTYINSKRAISTICREVKNQFITDRGSKKPIIFAFGNGNGNMTINNTKNSSAHGPIKRIAKALSMHMRVVITDEYNTSKLCSECDVPLLHPKTHKTESYKNMYRRLFGIKAPITFVKRLKNYFRDYHPTLKRQLSTNKRSYALCCCQSKDHKSDNRLRNRDYHGSENLRRVMRARIIGNKISAFERPKIKKSSVKPKKSKIHPQKSD